MMEAGSIRPSLPAPSFLILVVKLKPCTLLVRLADLPRINNIVIAWLSGQVAADIMITGKSVCCFSFRLASSLTLLIYCYIFLKLVITVVLTTIFARSKTGIRRTDSVLNRLIRGTIQTGLFASIFSLGDLLTFLTLPDTNLYGMFAIPIGRIYTNVSTCTVFSFNNSD